LCAVAAQLNHHLTAVAFGPSCCVLVPRASHSLAASFAVTVPCVAATRSHRQPAAVACALTCRAVATRFHSLFTAHACASTCRVLQPRAPYPQCSCVWSSVPSDPATCLISSPLMCVVQRAVSSCHVPYTHAVVACDPMCSHLAAHACIPTCHELTPHASCPHRSCMRSNMPC